MAVGHHPVTTRRLIAKLDNARWDLETLAIHMGAGERRVAFDDIIPLVSAIVQLQAAADEVNTAALAVCKRSLESYTQQQRDALDNAVAQVLSREEQKR